VIAQKTGWPVRVSIAGNHEVTSNAMLRGTPAKCAEGERHVRGSGRSSEAIVLCLKLLCQNGIFLLSSSSIA
jgi:hypothetical protein